MSDLEIIRLSIKIYPQHFTQPKRIITISKMEDFSHTEYADIIYVYDSLRLLWL